MRIIDSLIYNDEFEGDLLYWKLLIESPCVDEWCISHNTYNYHGDFKGDRLKSVLNQERFKPFWDRIVEFPLNQKFSDPSEASSIDPGSYANAEWTLRDAPTKYLLERYCDDDRVFSSDVDEIIDFTDIDRQNRLKNELETDDPLQFDRIRYIYDVDNIAPRAKFDMITPAFKIKHLKNGIAKLRDKKWIGRQVPNGISPMIFEYCHCFGYEGYISKHMSSLHTQWNVDKLKFAVDINGWPMTQYQGLQDLNTRWHWFEKIVLDENNSPKYIREQILPNWKNMVPLNYRENRIKYFGRNPSFTANGDGNFDN